MLARECSPGSIDRQGHCSVIEVRSFSVVHSAPVGYASLAGNHPGISALTLFRHRIAQRLRAALDDGRVIGSTSRIYSASARQKFWA